MIRSPQAATATDESCRWNEDPRPLRTLSSRRTLTPGRGQPADAFRSATPISSWCGSSRPRRLAARRRAARGSGSAAPPRRRVPARSEWAFVPAGPRTARLLSLPGRIAPATCRRVCEFADGTSLQEPELFYLPFARRSGPPEPIGHPLPFEGLLSVAVGLPQIAAMSEPSRLAGSEGLIRYFHNENYLLELGFLSTKKAFFDLRPELPLVLRSAPHETT